MADLYMVASGGGTIGPGTSTNLVDWVFTDEFSGLISFGAICASRTQFCLFGTVAEIYTSPGDPLTFTQRVSPSAGSAAIASCDHDGEGVVLAGGSNESGTRYIYYSEDDGDTWSRVDSGLDRNITVVRGIPGHYVAFGQDGRVAYATNVAGPWTADNTSTALPFDRIDDALFERNGDTPTGRIFASGREDGTAVTTAAYSDDYGATWTLVTGLAGAGSGNLTVRIAQDLTGTLDDDVILTDTNDVIWKNAGNGTVNFTDTGSNYTGDAWGPIATTKFLNAQFIFLQNGWGIQEAMDTFNVSPVPATDIGATVPIAPTGNPAGPDGIAFLSGIVPPAVTYYTHVFA